MNENDCMEKESIKRKRKFCRNFVTLQGQFQTCLGTELLAELQMHYCNIMVSSRGEMWIGQLVHSKESRGNWTMLFLERASVLRLAFSVPHSLCYQPQLFGSAYSFSSIPGHWLEISRESLRTHTSLRQTPQMSFPLVSPEATQSYFLVWLTSIAFLRWDTARQFWLMRF